MDGQYKIRTCDPFDVNEVRYHCANCPLTKEYTGLRGKCQGVCVTTTRACVSNWAMSAVCQT